MSALERFVAEYESLSVPNGFNPRERFFGEDAIVELWPFDGKIHLSSIRAITPNTGAGTRTMRVLLALADKHGVTIDGTAKPFKTHAKTGTLKTRQLIAWYVRLGFTRVGRDRIVYVGVER